MSIKTEFLKHFLTWRYSVKNEPSSVFNSCLIKKYNIIEHVDKCFRRETILKFNVQENKAI